MSSFEDRLEELASNLYDIEAFKFGNYILKTGQQSPVYFDLRVIVSHPNIMETVSNLILEFGLTSLECDHLCGVPYTALPIATILSIKSKLPMLIRRKEVKTYGTKKLIEGQYKNGDNCVIIEDVISSGSSVMETTRDLRREGLIVTHAFVILDRQQGALTSLLTEGIQVRSLFTLMKLMGILVKIGKINQCMADSVQQYLNTSQLSLPYVPASDTMKRTTLSFSDRANLTENVLTKRIFSLMVEKKTNLCVAADLTKTVDILTLLEKVGPYICIFKMHVDIIEDFEDSFIQKLVILAKKHNVLLMEDRKYADIGNTVALQYSSGVHKVSSWADLVTAHALAGAGVIHGIKSVCQTHERGVFLVAEMSSENNLITPQYSEATLKLASDESKIVVGIVCQTKGVVVSPCLIQLTPGVQINSSGDGLGQKYNTPRNVILDKGADIAVVGRGIIKSPDQAEEAKLYRDKLWECYLQRIA